LICVYLHSSFPAFVVANQDSRVGLRLVTHSPTFVFESAFSFSLKVSDIRVMVPNIDLFVLKTIARPILQNISDSIMEVLQDVLAAYDGPMFAALPEEHWDTNPDFSTVVIQHSRLIVALNCSGRIGHPAYQSFQDLNLQQFQWRVINLVHGKTHFPEVRNLISNETLQARFSLPILKSNVVSL
jgi:hypothetical protein